MLDRIVLIASFVLLALAALVGWAVIEPSGDFFAWQGLTGGGLALLALYELL